MLLPFKLAFQNKSVNISNYSYKIEIRVKIYLNFVIVAYYIFDKVVN